ncbi:hypothetical protein LTT66_33965 [Nocardia gipuzkoensis]|uniref:hypothetical protein n=1 Tax=Nocardia gipuzkoensis TaxID=2749991 RepID=UPI001E354BDC|nr:hypothetical protein [Nocardia gipuzkoensis]UGT68114.1 hypothetical protein LTT66_33965 [Nocardia gipuzkoensis]
MTDTTMSFREQLLHPDPEVRHCVLGPLYHRAGEGHQQCRERLTAVLDLLNEKVGEYLHEYQRVLSRVSPDDFALVVDALARTGTEHLAESLGITVHNGYGLRPRTAVLVGMLAGGWASQAADQLLSGGPVARDATLDRPLLHRRAQDLDAVEPLESTFVDECAWYAVPTSDQAAVLDAFQLTGAVPVGFREAARLFDAQGDLPPDKAVVVTPAFDGWTLLVHKGVLEADLEALSARFGAAHSYGHGYQSGCGDWSDWTVAEQGKVLQSCFYDLYGNDSMGPASRDEMLAWINERRRPATPRLLAADDPAFDNYNDWEFDAESVAHGLSVSLHRVGSHTTVKGTSLLATPITP